jgi:hypothetical protein
MPTSITSSGITFDDATTLTTGVLTAANIASGAVTPAKLSQPLTLATAVSASGVAIDFTSIPSWAKRITVIFYSVSTSGGSPVIVQIGSGSLTTSGYSSHASATEGSVVGTSASGVGFITEPSPSTGVFVRFGALRIMTLGSGLWVSEGLQGVSGGSGARVHYSGGAAPTLSGALDRVRLTTVNGTDTFDAGSVNIMYEG